MIKKPAYRTTGHADATADHMQLQLKKAVPMKQVSPPSMKMFFPPAPCSLFQVRRQEAEGTYVSPQLGIQTPPEQGRLNRRLSRGLNPCTRVVAFLWFGHFREGINSFSIAALCLLPFLIKMV